VLTSRRLEKDDWFETLDRVNWFNETVVEPDPGINQKNSFSSRAHEQLMMLKLSSQLGRYSSCHATTHVRELILVHLVLLAFEHLNRSCSSISLRTSESFPYDL